MKKALIVVTVLVLFLSIGCATNAGSASGVALTADKTGDRILLTLRNSSASPVQYNLCSSGLQRRAGASWEDVSTNEICTMELRTLESGGTATLEKTLPAGLTGGEYRYSTNVHISERGTPVASNSFRAP